MTQQNKVNRRKFLKAAGAAVAGAGAVSNLTPSASAQGVLKIRKKPAIPYKPDVLVVGGGPAGIGAALGAAARGANTLLIEHHAFFGDICTQFRGGLLQRVAHRANNALQGLL